MELSQLSDEELINLALGVKMKVDVFNTRQSTFKVLNNSLYGTFGSVHFRWYDVFNATAITLSGQAGIQVASIGANAFISKIVGYEGDWIVASDTDSMYLNVSKVVEAKGWQPSEVVDKLDEFASGELGEEVNRVVDQFNKDTNAMTNRLNFKREAIAHGIIVAKKRYIFLVHDNEGVRYSTPELKVTGMESRRSSTPKWCREKLEDSYRMFFGGNEKAFHAFVKGTKEEFMKLPIETISGASTANNLAKYTGPDGLPISKTPAHIKGAIAYNRYVKTHKIQADPVRSGEKVKVVPLVEPNPFGSDVLSFSDKLSENVPVEEYVDRTALFDKFYQDPLQRVADVLQWSCVRRAKLL